MKSCKCGSFAINPQCHGREPGVGLDLCDVCYWRARAERLQAVAELVVWIFRPMQNKGQNGHTFELLLLRAESALEGLER